MQDVIDAEVVKTTETIIPEKSKELTKIKSAPMSDARRRRLEELLDQHIKPLQDYIEEVQQKTSNDLSQITTDHTKEKDNLYKHISKLEVALETVNGKRQGDLNAITLALNEKYDKAVAKALALADKWKREKSTVLIQAESDLNAKYSTEHSETRQKIAKLNDKIKDLDKKISIEKSVRRNILDKITRQIKGFITDRRLELHRVLWSKTDSDAEELFNKIPTVADFQEHFSPKVFAGFYLEQVKELVIPQKCILMYKGQVCNGDLTADSGSLRCNKCSNWVEIETPTKFDVNKLLPAPK